MESHPQNPEFRDNPENFHPWDLQMNCYLDGILLSLDYYRCRRLDINLLLVPFKTEHKTHGNHN